MKILFFIGALEAGGRERRLIELLSYLKKKTDYNLMVVIRRDKIEYPAFYKLNIPYKILAGRYKQGDKTLIFKFCRLCKEYKPDIVHTWGSMPAFVSLLAIILFKIPHINSQISDAPTNIKKWGYEYFRNRANFLFSSIILANSYAGLKAYGVDSLKTSRVIYNGLNLSRFRNLPAINEMKLKYNITTTYAVIMTASFTMYKNNDLFFKVAEIVTGHRNDTTFINIGGWGNEDPAKFNRLVFLSGNNPKILIPGRISDVEAFANACDIGVLFSPNGEGISNAILEYMALGKPVIANDTGGTKEIVKHGVNGYLITHETPEEIAGIINELLNDKEKRLKMGEAGRKLIHEYFTIDRMGKEFENVYQDIISPRLS